MRELPEPTMYAFLDGGRGIYVEGGPLGEKFFDEQAVLAIQKQAYEDGLRDAASLAKVISDKYAVGHYGQEVDTADEIESEILALLTASQKEQK